MTQHTIYKPKDLTRTLKQLDKLRDREHPNTDYLSWHILTDKLTIRHLTNQGTIYSKTFDLCEQHQELKLVTKLSSFIHFDCKDNESIVNLTIHPEGYLILTNLNTHLQATGILYPTSTYFIQHKHKQSTQDKYFKLQDLKKIMQGLNTKEHGSHICVNIIDNCMILKTELVDVQLMRTR